MRVMGTDRRLNQISIREEEKRLLKPGRWQMPDITFSP